MASSSVEARLEALEKELTKLKDERAIQELMSRHAVNHTQKNMHRSIDFLALDEPDVSVEIGDRGVYKGPEAVTKLYTAQYGSAPLEGNLLLQYVTTPSIQVAGDGNTARGMWRCLQVEAVVPRQEGGGEPDPIWACGAYGVDFIKKGSEWKILHLHWFRTTKSSHYHGWVRDTKWLFAGALPNSGELGQTTYHNPYTVDSIQDSVPPCPAPYDTFDGSGWMVKDQSELWRG